VFLLAEKGEVKMAKRRLIGWVVVAVLLVSARAAFAEKAGVDSGKFRLGVCTSSFKGLTLYESIDKAVSLGIKWIEVYPGQRLSRERPDIKFDDSLSAELRREVKAKLAKAGVGLASYGVVKLPHDQRKWLKVIYFADDMGFESISAEPEAHTVDFIEVMSERLVMLVGLHNGSKGEQWWSPEKIVRFCDYRSHYLGACVDGKERYRGGCGPEEAKGQDNYGSFAGCG